jgi:tellurite methyltransferase
LKDMLAKNINRYRKEKGLTQESLAQKLGITYQAVSKWENAQTMPDIALLPDISKVLEVSVDKLLGYISYNKQVTIYEEEYATPEYYWGIKPNSACYQVLELLPPTSTQFSEYLNKNRSSYGPVFDLLFSIKER